MTTFERNRLNLSDARSWLEAVGQFPESLKTDSTKARSVNILYVLATAESSPNVFFERAFLATSKRALKASRSIYYSARRVAIRRINYFAKREKQTKENWLAINWPNWRQYL
jgi:hypothetical protein